MKQVYNLLAVGLARLLVRLSRLLASLVHLSRLSALLVRLSALLHSLLRHASATTSCLGRFVAVAVAVLHNTVQHNYTLKRENKKNKNIIEIIAFG